MSAVLDTATVGAATVSATKAGPASVGAASAATGCREIATEVAPTSAARNVGAAIKARAPAITAVLLGTGVIGGALLRLLDTPPAAAVRLVGVANSRWQRWRVEGLARGFKREDLQAGERRDDACLLAALDASGAACKVVIDATANVALAARHASWLARGFHVVTANKALAGGALPGWRALQAACAGGAHYGDSATIGAGLPVLSTLRRLRQCGDHLLTLEGVFSGSLSWLFNHYDGSRPFSALLRMARELGYTEPDPRTDLSGEDVARKLLILSRNAGFMLDSDEVQVTSLVPTALRAVDAETFLRRAPELDAPLAARHATAQSHGAVLRYLARLNQRGLARVGLVEVPITHPAARLYGTDNQFAFTTTRYNTQPLVIQGPGAGPDITAQALLADVLGLLHA